MEAGTNQQQKREAGRQAPRKPRQPRQQQQNLQQQVCLFQFQHHVWVHLKGDVVEVVASAVVGTDVLAAAVHLSPR
jgi:hypothetical protein